MKSYNLSKLTLELRKAGITTHGNCGYNELGVVVWDDENNEIQDRPDVRAVLGAHDPTPDPEPPSLQERLEAAELFLGLLLDQEVTR